MINHASVRRFGTCDKNILEKENGWAAVDAPNNTPLSFPHLKHGAVVWAPDLLSLCPVKCQRLTNIMLQST